MSVYSLIRLRESDSTLVDTDKTNLLIGVMIEKYQRIKNKAMEKKKCSGMEKYKYVRRETNVIDAAIKLTKPLTDATD